MSFAIMAWIQVVGLRRELEVVKTRLRDSGILSEPGERGTR